MESSTPWPVKQVDDCYHIYSDGTGKSGLYESSEDKIYCMNLLAIAADICQVTLLCIVVEETHFHGIARGTPSSVLRYADLIKEQQRRHFKGHPDATRIVISVDPIQDDQELMRKIIYVFRNPSEAGYPYLPFEYHWGVGRIYFEDPAHCQPDGRRVGDLSQRQVQKLLHTKRKLPPYWRIDDEGMILPRDYIDVDYVQQLFVTPKRFMAFLHVRKKDLVDIEMDLKMRNLGRMDDEAMRDWAREECQKMFGRDIRGLNSQQRLLMARHLWNSRRVFSLKQLSRLSRLPFALIDSVFGSAGSRS